MPLQLKNHRKWFIVGTALLLTAPPSFALFGMGDTLEQVLAPRYMAWLTFENDNGANIYVSANPLRTGSRNRTKECIASVRHLYIDIDEDGDARLAALRASDRVPAPTTILSTSPGKYQALWRVAGFDFERQEQTLKLLATPLAAIPLAPTEIECCASPVSTTGSILPPIVSRSNTPPMRPTVPPTSGLMPSLALPCCRYAGTHGNLPP